MNAVWSHPFQSTRKLVALSLADQANDSGECYPSIPRIAERCGLSERGVHMALVDLESDGMFTRVSRNGRSTLYKLTDPTTWKRPTHARHSSPAPRAPLNDVHPTTARHSPPPLHVIHPTPARHSPITTIEPKERAKAKEKSAQREKAALPSWLPADAWENFVAYRKRRGGWTEHAADLNLKKLAKLRDEGNDPVVLLETAIERGWSGLFVPREFGKTGPPASLRSQVEAAMDEFGGAANVG